MTAKTKTAPRSIPLRSEGLPAASPPPPLWTTEERLRHIEALGQRITGYIQFMCQVGDLKGTSAEAKERAVIAFYERMVVLENQLSRVQEELKLG